MKHFFLLLFFSSIGSISGFLAHGQAPTTTANDAVRPYTEGFQYGVNMGYYGPAWNDESLAGLAQSLGGHSVRPTLPEYFVTQYGYTIRASTFAAYVNTLGMKGITCFVEGPSAAHRDPMTYPGASGQSKLFANLYEPIWNSDGSVNANNYYAHYLYQLLQIYGDKVRFWEVVNEPDFTYGQNVDDWLTRPPLPSEMVNVQAPIYHYIRMLRISYEVVKRYHPEAYVTTGGVGYPSFVDALLRYTDNPNGGTVTAQYPLTAGAYLDALSFHSYPAYSLHYWDNSTGSFRYTRTSDYAASKVMEDRQKMVDVLNRYGYNGTTRPAKHLIITETNIARRTSDDRTGSDEMQRSFGIKTLVLAQKNSIRQLYFFSLGEAINAPPPNQPVSGADEIALMGLYENLNRDAPGAQRTTQLGQAFATTAKLLYGFVYDAARTAALALPSGVEGAAFSNNGRYTYVLWAKALVDNSEVASATYSFPAALNLGSVQRYEWNYSTTAARTTQAVQNIALSGSPAFFTAGPASAGSTAATRARITFTFATPPASATARIAPTLYNKSRVLQYEEEGSPLSIYADAYPLLKGGVVRNGQTYPGLRFTDGCGHRKPYTAAVAINGHNPVNNSVWLDAGPQHDPTKLLWAQAQELLNTGWDVENNSDLNTAPNPAQQVATLDALIANRLQGYKPAVLAVPANYAGYCTAAFAAGYAAAASTSQSDNLPLLNPFTAGRVPLGSLPFANTPFVYQRYGADRDTGGGETAQAQQARLEALSDALLAPAAAGAAATEVYLQRVFSHGMDFGVLSGWLNHTQTAAQDRLWVTTLREFAEYRRVSGEVSKTETLTGNTLTVDLDYAGLSPDTRFQNLTLLVDSPGTVTSIVVTGADSSSSNPATKLVNIFRGRATVVTAATAPAGTTPRAALSVYPNPAGRQATAQFSVPKSGPVTLALYNLQGRLVRRLFAGPVAAGVPHQVPVNALNVSAGLYFVRLVTETDVVSYKLSYTGE